MGMERGDHIGHIGSGLLQRLADNCGVPASLLAESIVALSIRNLGEFSQQRDRDGDFTISIDDGYVEYSYQWKLPSSWSIDLVVRNISRVLGDPEGDGVIRTSSRKKMKQARLHKNSK